jgi:hypothetical protein
VAPQRHCHDPLALQHPLWHLRLHVAEERVQHGQPLVQGADRAVPLLRQVIEEGLHEAYVDVGQGQALDGNAATVASEAQQQREHIAVGLDRVRAQVALAGQVAREEVRHVHREVGRLHDGLQGLRGMTSLNAASDRETISGYSSAVRV